MTETITIQLSKLLAWEGNVRQTEPDKNIDELAASIASRGLLQSLVVKKDKRGKYAVIAGQRRLLALKSLAADGRIENDLSIPCALIDGDADATEISLVQLPFTPTARLGMSTSILHGLASIRRPQGESPAVL